MRNSKRICAVATLLLVLGGGVAAWAEADFLAVLEERYSGVQSVHVKAQANITAVETADSLDAPLGGLGSFEYWAEGPRYRIICNTHQSLASLGLLDDNELAFDGALYQFLRRETSMLSVRATEPDFFPTALPNPFFLPLRFLVENVYALRLQDLAGSSLWRARVSEATQGPKAPHTAFPLSPHERFYEISGRSPDEDVEYLLAVTEVGELSRVETRTRTGVLLSTFEFADYAPVSGAGWAFPRQLVIHEYSPDDQLEPARHIEFRVLAIDVDTVVDPTVFTIDRSTVEYVWDADARRYLKRPGVEPNRR